MFEFFVTDQKLVGVSKGLIGIVFTLDDEDLEDFPSEWCQTLHLLTHIFFEVQTVHDCVDLEPDAMLFTFIPELVK